MRKTIWVILFSSFLFTTFLISAFDDRLTSFKKFAQPGATPLMNYAPSGGTAQGYVLYADLDGNSFNGSEAIVAYRIRVSDAELETTAGINPQYVEVDVFQNGKKLGSILKIELTYAYTPKIFMTTAKLFKNELPKVFIMVYDGVDKTPDKLYTLMYNGLDPKDKKRKNIKYETVKMPWHMLLNPLNIETPMIMEYSTKLRQGLGYFYPRTVDLDKGTPTLTQTQTQIIKKMAKECKGQLEWENGMKE